MLWCVCKGCMGTYWDSDWSPISLLKQEAACLWRPNDGYRKVTSLTHPVWWNLNTAANEVNHPRGGDVFERLPLTGKQRQTREVPLMQWRVQCFWAFLAFAHLPAYVGRGGQCHSGVLHPTCSVWKTGCSSRGVLSELSPFDRLSCRGTRRSKSHSHYLFGGASPWGPESTLLLVVTWSSSGCQGKLICDPCEE